MVATPPAHADPEVILETPPVTTGGQVLTVTQDLNLSGPDQRRPTRGPRCPRPQQCDQRRAVRQLLPGHHRHPRRARRDPRLGPGDRSPGSRPRRTGCPAARWTGSSTRRWPRRGHQGPRVRRAGAGLRAARDPRLHHRPAAGHLEQEAVRRADDRAGAEAYDELKAIYKDRLVQEPKWALEEYDKWNDNPCGYVAAGAAAGERPDRPSPTRPAKAPCAPRLARAIAVWAVTNGTPPLTPSTSGRPYRHPTPAMKAAGDTNYQFALTADRQRRRPRGYGVAVGAGVASGWRSWRPWPWDMSAIGGCRLGLWTLGWSASAATSLGLAIVGTVAFALAAIVVALIGALARRRRHLADGRGRQGGADLRDRAARAAANNDPLGIEAVEARLRRSRLRQRSRSRPTRRRRPRSTPRSLPSRGCSGWSTTGRC